MTLEEALKVVKQLSLIDKVRLMEVVAPQIREELLTQQQPQPKKPLRGLWRGTDTTDEDITEIRQEMWRKFPREDVY